MEVMPGRRTGAPLRRHSISIERWTGDDDYLFAPRSRPCTSRSDPPTAARPQMVGILEAVRRPAAGSAAPRREGAGLAGLGRDGSE
jgi:hypothetical protein